MIKLGNSVSMWDEIVSYETIWSLNKGSLKSVAELFERFDALPSQVLDQMRAEEMFPERELDEEIEVHLKKLRGFSTSVHRTFQYPLRLRDARYPIEMFYYRGDLGLARTRSISIVGARSSSDEGLQRAKRMARELVEAGFTIVSGLAKGIDTAAMQSAIEAGGCTVGVIGTTITQSYPKENQYLQDRIAKDFLLMSHVPMHWYTVESFQSKKRYFPERNAIMSALSEATVIVEASERSGTLTQARACMQQGRKLFILNSCFENKDITWPERFQKQGAIRVREIDDVISILGKDGLPKDACE